MVHVFEKKLQYVLILSTIIVLSCFTVGYAYLSQTIDITGEFTVLHDGGTIAITSIEYMNGSNVLSSEPIIDEDTVSFNIQFSGTEETYEAVYEVKLKNSSVFPCVYSNMVLKPTIVSSSGASATLDVYIDGINPGESIPPGDEVTMTITFILHPTDNDSTYDVSAETEVESSKDMEGELLASISPISANLKGDTVMEVFTLSLANTYSFNNTFTVNSSNEHFIVVDNNGDALSSFTIASGDEEDYTIYIKRVDDVRFLSDSEDTTISVVASSGIVTAGTVTLYVDKYIPENTDPPTIGNVTITMDTANEGAATVSWQRVDDANITVTNYTVMLYNTNNTLISTNNTNSGSTFSYRFMGLNAGNYYVKVYGTTTKSNGSSSCNNATTANGYCAKSANTSLKWYFTITYDLSYMGHSNDNPSNGQVFYGNNFTVTLTANDNFSLPTSGSVKVTTTSGNRNWTDFTYTQSNGSMTIRNITDDLTISATGVYNGGCLMAGTKILLANGNYKNIEDITYNDLLAVINHDTGKITYVYPVWIERDRYASKYQKTTFSDGSSINTISYHGLFSMDDLEWVSVLDRDKFHIGTRVAKLDNGKTKVVTVTNIETIYDNVAYYDIISNRYLNVIANDFITTEGMIASNNVFKYNADLTWRSKSNPIDISSLFSWYDWSDNKLNHLLNIYNSFDDNIKSAFYNGYYDIKLFAELVNDLMKEPDKNNNGNYLWVVTNSDDLSGKLYEDGSLYTLPEPINKVNFVGWYNTADDKIYLPGDVLPVNYSIYFESVYK